MNRKSILAILLILLLAAGSILGLPLFARCVERKAENAVSTVTATPAPVYEDWDEDAGI